MTEKRFWYDFEDCTGAKIVDFKEDKEYPLEIIGDFRKIEKLLNEQHEQIEDLKDTNVRCCNEYSYFHKRMMELEKENEQLKQQKKGQELEIVRLHKLADAMSGVLRELGIYDVYNKEQINNVKKRLDK